MFTEYCKIESETKPLIKENIVKMLQYTKDKLGTESGNVQNITVTKLSFQAKDIQDIVIQSLNYEGIHFDSRVILVDDVLSNYI